MKAKKPAMLCSVIIPTIGRSTLTRAVESVLMQRLPASELEVIIVNDSGVPLPDVEWLCSEQVQVINTNRRERSVARNTGAAVAKGRYLHFLDDDDWLFPGAHQHLSELSQTSSAQWLYGMTQLMNRENDPLIQLSHGLQGNCFAQAMAGEWIPLQASWIDRMVFMRIGGFNPLLTGPEDIDLLRRALLEVEIAETQNLIANVIMGGNGSTTDYDHHPQASRWARENILDRSNVFDRICSSASSPFWYGRIVRVYLTSSIWNLQHYRLFNAISRVFYSIKSLFASGSSVFSKDFWSAILKSYSSRTFEAGILEAQTQK
ncbi:MAG TPA: glycosyltransferase family A protein [Anaerolineales bacterium]|nr:glycosyltransferase family A protein [Anaerolineales bacterium]